MQKPDKLRSLHRCYGSIGCKCRVALNRRSFLAVFLGCFTLLGCKSKFQSKPAPIALASYKSIKQGRNTFTLERVVVVRDGDTFRAMSLVCSHQACLLREESEGFLCPCHGSRFNNTGAVLNGPAKDPLTHYQLSIEAEQLVLHIGQVVEPGWRLKLPSS